MTREDKKKIERRAYWHDLLRQLRGTPDFPVKLFFLALFLVGAVYVATKQAILREQVKHIELISPILKAAMEHAVTAYLFVGGLALLTLLLYPFGRRATKDQLQCIGLAGSPFPLYMNVTLSASHSVTFSNSASEQNLSKKEKIVAKSNDFATNHWSG